MISRFFFACAFHAAGGEARREEASPALAACPRGERRTSGDEKSRGGGEEGTREGCTSETSSAGGAWGGDERVRSRLSISGEADFVLRRRGEKRRGAAVVEVWCLEGLVDVEAVLDVEDVFEVLETRGGRVTEGLASVRVGLEDTVGCGGSRECRGEVRVRSSVSTSNCGASDIGAVSRRGDSLRGFVEVLPTFSTYRVFLVSSCLETL